MGKGPGYFFLKRRNTDGQQVYEKCSTLLIIKEMQIKTTVRFHFASVRMAVIKKTRGKCGLGYGKRGTLYTVGTGYS